MKVSKAVPVSVRMKKAVGRYQIGDLVKTSRGNARLLVKSKFADWEEDKPKQAPVVEPEPEQEEKPRRRRRAYKRRDLIADDFDDSADE